MTVIYLDKQKHSILLILLTGITAVGLGILIGYFATSKSQADSSIQSHEEIEKTISSVLGSVESDKIRSYLKFLTAEPHIAGGPRDLELTDWIRDKWTEFGLDTVSLDTYNFLLSFPDSARPNKIHLLDAEGNVRFTSHHQEDLPASERKNFIDAFIAFAPPGDVTAELVYVNYGRLEDIQKLKELGVSLEGKIAISRYGKIFRGNRLKNCQAAGAVGVIMYTDPAQVAPRGTDPGSVYPNTFFLPPSGVQRGTTFIEADPLSPTWPSVAGAYRLTVNETSGLPQIPAQPIGYGDAEQLLATLGGPEVPEDWRGTIPGLTYRLGPGPDQQHAGWKVRLVVNNYLEDKTSDNVIGVIHGSEEPDRYVIICNHRDAWGYGAVDPSSGTAIMMEVARVLGQKVKSGWRPRRSIVFASWAAEEAGIMGSAEWVYDKVHKLINRAVGLVNIDAPIQGPILLAYASPTLTRVFLNAIKGIPSTADSTKTYFQFLEEFYQRDNSSTKKSVKENIKLLGSGTDHASFAFYAGVPATYQKFKIDKLKYPGVSGYPTYHTGFETFHLVDKIIDPGFVASRASTQISLHIILQLSESPVIPYSLQDMTRVLEKELKKDIFTTLRDIGLVESLDVMVEAFQKFKYSVLQWERETEKLQSDGFRDKLRLRRRNDQQMLLERIFLLPQGLPGQQSNRHALFSPAKFNSYAGSAFPGLADLLHGFDELDPEKRGKRMKELRKHLSDLMIVLRQASSWLQEETLI